MKMLKKAFLASIFIGVFVLFIFAVFFSSTLANSSDGSKQMTTQTGVKGSSEAEREHGYCSDSHPVRGASTCPANGMPKAGP